MLCYNILLPNIAFELIVCGFCFVFFFKLEFSSSSFFF